MQISFDLILLRAWQLSRILVRATPVTGLCLLFPSLLFLCSHFKHPGPHCITKALFFFMSRAITHVHLMKWSLLTHIDCTFLGSSLYAATLYVCSAWEYVTDFCSSYLIFKKRKDDLYICHFLLILRCLRLGLQPLAYLWRRDQESLLAEMISSNLRAIIIKVAAFGEHLFHFNIIKRVILTHVWSFVVSVCGGAMSVKWFWH